MKKSRKKTSKSKTEKVKEEKTVDLEVKEEKLITLEVKKEILDEAEVCNLVFYNIGVKIQNKSISQNTFPNFLYMVQKC